MSRPSIILAAAVLAVGCAKKPSAPVYQALAVERRDIIVSAQASGSIKADTLIEVRSQASGEVTNIKVQTGDVVRRGALMIEIDPRTARNNVEQAQAALDVAKARLQNATAAKRRSDELFQSQAISETERDVATLDFANGNAELVRTRVALENARIALEQTEVRSPINGTVITKTVERGSVITSSTSGVGGGTILMTMADLNLVQVRTLVDETDIGKVQPGMRVTVTVDAYPNRPFEGTVAKIEPQAETSQNVTMFPVIVRIANREGLLRPGMNAEVEIHVGERKNVLAVSNSALRTQRDVASAASVLGLDPADVQRQLAVSDSATRAAAPATGDTANRASLGARSGQPAAPAKRTMTTPMGTMNLPDGVVMVRAANPQGRRGGQSEADTRLGGQYIVFVMRNETPVPVSIRTGLTDLDYSEVTSGLQEGDSVLALPSASLINSQSEMQSRINRMTGGGTVPGMTRQPTTTAPAAPSGAARTGRP
ncbi:MAG: efflux RND transporter periplasmic adaptor subunit [Gemmatimonadales bacterium]